MKLKKTLYFILIMAIFFAVQVTAAEPESFPNGNGETYEAGQLLIATTDNGTLSVDRLLYVAFKRINYHTNFICPIILEGYSMANAGTCDGVIAGKPDLDKEYENLIKVPVPLEDINVIVFTRSDNPLVINSWEELAGLSVGILENRTYILNMLPEDVKIFTKTTNRTVFEGLSAGEYDAAVLIERAYETLGEGADIIRAGRVDKLTEYLYLNKARAPLSFLLEGTLNRMFSDGSAGSILKDEELPGLNAKKTILHIVSNNIELQHERLLREAINERFHGDASIEIKTVNLDIGHSPQERYKLRHIANLLRAECVPKNIAAIVVSGEPALNFLMDYYYLYFRNVPVIFYGTSEDYGAIINDEPFTGIVEHIAAYDTVKTALSIFPDTKNIFVVNDFSPDGRRFNNAIEKQLDGFGGAALISYNENEDCLLLMRRISELPADSIILFGAYFSDASGQSFTLNEIEHLLSRYCFVPVFSLYCTELAYNSIGGITPLHQDFGETIADMLEEIFSGVKTADIPVIRDSSGYNRWVFDKNMLDKFSVSQKSLPGGATVINAPPSVWESYSQVIIIAIILVVLMNLILVAVGRFALIRNRDLKKIVTLQEELEISLKKTQEANDAKSKFIANVSHEIRTPLNAVIGLSALSLDTAEPNSAAAATLEKIYDSGMTILTIVNDILDISKIESEKFQIIAGEYEILSLINDAITQNLLYRGEKPVDFSFNCDEDVPARLYGDEVRVKQIISNLLSNAFKYTREGTVKLSIKCYGESDFIWLIIQVSDTGIGIHEDDLEKIMTEFGQADMDANRKIEGIGLGLPITKMLAELMDGGLSIKSEYGKGSIFTAKIKQIPATEATVDQAALQNIKNYNYLIGKRKESLNQPRVQLPDAKVLIVDDVATNMDVLRGLLKPYKMQTTCVTNARDAIDIMKTEENRYNAIFMDHMMPDIDGIEATKLIRQIGTEYARNIPIIAFTANAIVGNELMFKDAGFQDFLSKPIDIKWLDMIINRWIKDKSTVAAPPWIDGIDMQKSLEHFEGDMEFLLDILHSFVVNTPALMEKAVSQKNDDPSGYIIAIHGIKGSLRTIAAGAFADRAEALEKAAKAGDFEYVSDHNDAFLNDIKGFISDVEKYLNCISVTKNNLSGE